MPVRWELEHGCKATWSATGTPSYWNYPGVERVAKRPCLLLASYIG